MGNGNHIGEIGAVRETTVFVSYSREDQKRARPIIDLLEAAGFSVWWDGLLEGGERFSRSTEDALERAKAIVVLWSATSINSHWVHDEATRGRDRRCLVPLSIDGSEAPLGFRQFQIIDARPAKVKPTTPEMQSLIRSVSALHNESVEDHRMPTATRFTANRRSLLIGGGALGVAAIGGVAWFTGVIGGTSATAASVAVMPFENLSGDPGQAYFSDGLAAEVRSELTRNPLLQVAAQTSSSSFRDNQDDIKTIMGKLDVAYLLKGDVRRAGDGLEISAVLVDRSGFQKWQDSFNGPVDSIFAIQSEIATAIASQLSAQIAVGSKRGEVDIAKTGGTKSVAAFDAYLRGKDLFEAGADEASDRLALAKFDDAIGTDGNYAAAYAAKSRSLAVIGNQYAKDTELRALYRAAVIAAERAVALAPEYAEAHSALGFALAVGEMNVRKARQPYETSLKLGGGDADILSRYATFCSRLKRFDEANATITKSLSLDPLNARTFRAKGTIFYAMGQYAEAIDYFKRGLALNSKLSSAHAIIGQAQYMLGQIDEAEISYTAEKNRLFGLPGLAIIAQRKGDMSKAQAALDSLISEHGDNGLYQQAQVYAQWRDAPKAIAALLAARAAGDSGLIQMYYDPLLAPVQKEPEFSRLLKDIGFV